MMHPTQAITRRDITGGIGHQAWIGDAYEYVHGSGVGTRFGEWWCFELASYCICYEAEDDVSK